MLIEGTFRVPLEDGQEQQYTFRIEVNLADNPQAPQQPAGEAPQQPAGEAPQQPAGEAPRQPAGEAPLPAPARDNPPEPAQGQPAEVDSLSLFCLLVPKLIRTYHSASASATCRHGLQHATGDAAHRLPASSTSPPPLPPFLKRRAHREGEEKRQPCC
jgi:hypothetical protein